MSDWEDFVFDLARSEMCLVGFGVSGKVPGTMEEEEEEEEEELIEQSCLCGVELCCYLNALLYFAVFAQVGITEEIYQPALCLRC